MNKNACGESYLNVAGGQNTLYLMSTVCENWPPLQFIHIQLSRLLLVTVAALSQLALLAMQLAIWIWELKVLIWKKDGSLLAVQQRHISIFDLMYIFQSFKLKSVALHL